MWSFIKSIFTETPEDKQKRTFNNLEMEAVKKAASFVIEITGKNNARVHYNTRQTLTETGALRATVFMYIDPFDARKAPQFKYLTEEMITRKVFAHILNSFVEEDFEFVRNIKDDMSFEAIYDKITEFIVKRHGEKKFDEIVNSAKLNDEADIQCYVTLHLDYDTRIGEMDFADIKPKIYCTTNSAFMLDSEKENGFMPYGKWAKTFVNGEAGAKSQEYAIRRKNFLSGKSNISEEDLEDEMVINAIKKVRNTPENESVTVDIPGGQMTMTGSAPSNDNDIEDEQEKTFRIIEKQAMRAFKESLEDLMPWNKAMDVKIETRRKVFPDGMMQVIIIGAIDLATAKKYNDLISNLDLLRIRQQVAYLLNHFIGSGTPFLQNIKDDTRYEDVIEIMGEHYQILHGAKGWKQALLEAYTPIEQTAHCFLIFTFDYYTRELVKKGISFGENNNIQMTHQKAIHSDFSYESDVNEFQPLSVWIKEFLKGNAGPKSREYAIRLEHLRSGKGKISEEELKSRMESENKDDNDDIITEMIKSLIEQITKQPKNMIKV